ncbi:enoyl-CoA hydratase-related protein [Brevundimonas goettingensis]|uniref:Enoyl-CoA hydratase/isomerase family protein n=1 Tax=Brevundimonas goettingensis TaxID=2774190 RepID=A0A975BYS8_9CAUL|nr:enoyl-CoA hydratase-related protein [Brevundimonas goettingensis]QTC89915.1 enoyl-CoA hydratase/isomerase family protein [Brevundimonas goettingensis]
MAAFEITREGAVAHLRLTRPEASNALDMSFWRGFGPAVSALDRTGEVHALVISGEGRNFCAGMDISVFSSGAILPAETSAQRQAFHQAVRDLQDALTALEKARFPVIAAVHGACVGAGLDMVSACDLRLASADALFRIEEINIGMMADVGSLQRLPKILPEGVVRELAYLGNSLTAGRAERLGFVNAVLPDAEAVVAAALEMARTIAGKAPLAVTGSKAAIGYARDHTVAEGLEWVAVMQGSLWNPSDILTAIQARRSKETPAFAALAPLVTPGSEG